MIGLGIDYEILGFFRVVFIWIGRAVTVEPQSSFEKEKSLVRTIEIVRSLM